MKAILRSNLSFLFPYFIFLLLGAALIIANSKANTHLEFNSFHTHFFDVFFSYVTYLGDGVTAVLVVIILLVVKFRYALIVGLANIISAAITQTLKHTVFSNVVRPKKFFEGIHDLYFVPGVENYLYNSFPSGHSTCAFSLYFSLALILENKIYKSVLFVVAFLVGYSRIYLSQHFLQDVYAGSLIGVSISLVVYYFIQKSNKTWLEKSLVTVF
ncbi:MAG: phosphatase PAP2 family protein [Bacteroidia bacterium]